MTDQEPKTEDQTPQEESEEQEDWRKKVGEKKEVLKILDKEKKTFVFLSEGDKSVHTDYGESIVFTVEHEQIEKRWFVKPNNFSLLNQIKELGQPLMGQLVMVSRTGSKKSDTRYELQNVEPENAPEVTTALPADSEEEVKEDIAKKQEPAKEPTQEKTS